MGLKYIQPNEMKLMTYRILSSILRDRLQGCVQTASAFHTFEQTICDLDFPWVYGLVAVIDEL